MRKNRKIIIPVITLLVCVLIIWSGSTIMAKERSYRLEPEIRLPEYRTDTARAIDAYERMMQRFLDIHEKNLDSTSARIANVSDKVDCINTKLDQVLLRIARIEKALDISDPLADPNAPEPAKDPNSNQN